MPTAPSRASSRPPRGEIRVCDVDVTPFRSMDEAIRTVIDGSGGVEPGFGIAINPEKIVAARRDAGVRRTLQSATLRFADGVGVVAALWLNGSPTARRVPGCELWEQLMQRAGAAGVPVFLIGARPEVNERAAELLAQRFGVEVVGRQHGYFGEDEIDGLIDRIRASCAPIVTVALGSPAQERFILRCRQRHPDAFYLGVGGTYDVFTGSANRAPSWARHMNLEWAHRLWKNPTRFRRQLALLDFVAMVVRERWS